MSTHHPKERLIGELGVVLDGRKYAEDEADQHQHEPETEVESARDVTSYEKYVQSYGRQNQREYKEGE